VGKSSKYYLFWISWHLRVDLERFTAIVSKRGPVTVTHAEKNVGGRWGGSSRGPLSNDWLKGMNKRFQKKEVAKC